MTSRVATNGHAKTSRRQQDDAGMNLTAALSDTGNAELFAWQHGDRVRYCKAWKKWLVWDDRRWKVDDIGEVERLAKDTVRSISGEAAQFVAEDQQRAKLMLHGLRSENANRRAALLQLAQSEDNIPVAPERLDADAWLLNVLNGTVDLRTGRLREHRQRDLITKIAGAAFEASAGCPAWECFLARVTGGDTDLVAFLQKVAGYVLTGDVAAEALLFLVGRGANGKTTFVSTLQHVLGDYACSVSSDLLLASATDRGSNRASPDLLRLRGARLAVCGETDEGRALNAATVKQITSRDRIAARALYSDSTEFTPTHKLFLHTNHRPRVRSADEGTWRRIFLVPFEVTIPKAEQDPQLLEKLRTEASGILAWAVRGCLDWQKLGAGSRGLAPPDRVQEATRGYREEEDVIAPFLAEMCVVEPGARVAKGELFKSYDQWAQANNEHSVGSRTFNGRVKEMGGVRSSKTGSVRRWEGIGLRDARDATDAVSDNSSPARAHSELFENEVSSVPTVPTGSISAIRREEA